VPPEHADRIFERFERAASVRHYGGLGLGLYVTRQLAEAHGGSICLEASPGDRGARFVLRLPLQRHAVDEKGALY
jgi:two-component system, OmpR family, sensor kinase